MKQLKDLKFTTINRATIDTGLSYLGNINSSAKIVKNAKLNVLTYIIYLAPYNQSGYNVCKFASDECIKLCLHQSGRSAMDIIANKFIIQNARIKKSILFFENNEYFMSWVCAEIKQYQKKAIKDKAIFSIRLNGTSDINYLNYTIDNKTLFELFPSVQFYDYTKNPKLISDKLPANYHITFSYSGRNMKHVKKAIDKGLNIAVVFDVEKNNPLPFVWNKIKVIDGDITDYRPTDEKSCIVGLRYKKIANKQLNETIFNSCFIVAA